jgi:hypothetical protein
VEVGSGPEEPGGKGPERNREHVIYSMFVLDAVALSAEKRIEFTPPRPNPNPIHRGGLLRAKWKGSNDLREKKKEGNSVFPVRYSHLDSPHTYDTPQSSHVSQAHIPGTPPPLLLLLLLPPTSAPLKTPK